MQIAEIVAEANRRKNDVKTMLGIIESFEYEYDSQKGIVNPQITIKTKSEITPTKVLNLTPQSLDQTLYRLKIKTPLMYFAGQDNSDKVVSQIIKWGLKTQEDQSQFFIDERNNNKLFGVMSRKYVRVNDWDVITSAAGKFGNSDINLNFTYMNDMTTSVVFKTPNSFKVGKNVGDTIGVGVRVKNSEFGFAALTVEPFYEILRCTNGMTTKTVLQVSRYVHRKITIYDAYLTTLDDALKDAQKIIPIIEKAAARPTLIESKDKLGDYLYYNGIPRRLHEEILAAHEEEPIKLNGWGISNALTRAATHKVKDPDDQQLLMDASFRFLTITA